jgi:hypothetical protein
MKDQNILWKLCPLITMRKANTFNVHLAITQKNMTIYILTTNFQVI